MEHLVERRISLFTFHMKRPKQGVYAKAARCVGTAVLCASTAQPWPDGLGFFLGVTNLDFLTLHILRVGAQIMHHKPSLYRDRMWPLSAQSLGVRL